MIKLNILFLFLFSFEINAQKTGAPLEQNNFEKITSYDDIVNFVELLDQQSEMLLNEIIGKSVEGRNLYAMKFSSSEFGKDESKIKVLIFAQQHGNEQSGKEGALMLGELLLHPEYEHLFDRIDLALIP
jgi:murein tripeptide amidase MpaA